MALDADKVVAAITGAIFVAPFGAAAPTDFSTALDAAYKDVGYLGDGGFSLDPNETVRKLKAAQNGETVKVIRRGEDITVDFEMIELRSEEAQKLYWGSGATVAAGGLTVTVTNLSGSTPVALVVELVEDDVSTRFHFPKATLSQRGKITALTEDYQRMPVTLEAQKSSYFVKYWHST